MKTYQTEPNSIHYTFEQLKCDCCNKKVASVVEVNPDRFFCDGIHGCFLKRFPSLFSDEDFIEIRLIFDVDFKNRKETHKKRRQEVTPKIRYRILRRDGFACVLCGKIAKDITLEVDHIIPVSKGGDSSDKNLRSLCSLCNRGKSDEMV